MENTNRNQFIEILHQFILENYPKARQGILNAEDRLLEKGIIDSLGLLTLIDFLETKFQIKVSDLDVTEEKFGSIQSLANFIGEAMAKTSE